MQAATAAASSAASHVMVVLAHFAGLLPLPLLLHAAAAAARMGPGATQLRLATSSADRRAACRRLPPPADRRWGGWRASGGLMAALVQCPEHAGRSAGPRGLPGKVAVVAANGGRSEGPRPAIRQSEGRQEAVERGYRARQPRVKCAGAGHSSRRGQMQLQASRLALCMLRNECQSRAARSAAQGGGTRPTHRRRRGGGPSQCPGRA